MLQNRQFNRLLTTIVASLVAIAAVATVEAQIPQQELTVITSQLRSDCVKLMSDPRGQQELIRALRPHRAVLESKQAIKVLHAGGIYSMHSTTAATLPQMLVPAPTDTPLFTSVPIETALLAPAVTCRLHIRAPSFLS